MPDLFLSFRRNFITMSPGAKLVLLLLMVLFFALFGTLLAMIIAVPAYNYTLIELSEILTDPDRQNIGIFKFFQIVQSITLFILPSLMAAWLFSEKPRQFLNADGGIKMVTIFLVLLSILTAIPLLNYVTEINSGMNLPAWMDNIERKMIRMEETAAELTQLFLESNTISVLLVNFLMIAILPAIGEEFLFRGVIQNLFSQWFKSGHMAIIVTAFIFSFIHFQFFGFLPRFLLGLYFGYLLLWSGSIWIPVIAHLINNGMAVLYYHFSAGGAEGSTTIENIGVSGNSHYLLFLSVFLTFVIIGMIYLRERDESAGHRNFL